jgi:hypothetical protein
VTTIAGFGRGTEGNGTPDFDRPRGIAFDEKRGGLFVSDQHRIRFISLPTGVTRGTAYVRLR